MIRLSLIVTTIGRPDDVVRLVRSLEKCEASDQMELILVDQSDGQVAIKALVGADPAFPYTTLTSARGASTGRNVGAEKAAGEILGFPDDGVEYSTTTLAQVLTVFDQYSALDGISGQQVTSDGRPSMLRWPTSECDITRRNFYRTKIESTFFIRRSAWDAIGGFDETYGTGSAGPYQSGEISDLVLRGLALHQHYRYFPEIHIGQADQRDAVPAGFTDKMRGYGKGFGRLFRQHHLPPTLLMTLVARKYAAAAVRGVRGQGPVARADLAWANGMLWGYRKWHP